MAETTNSPGGIEVFVSYAHRDEALWHELEKHLALLRRQGVITTWYDRQITAGSDWAEEIDTRLTTAQIILLLISADFLASDYCYGIELQRAMERHAAKAARVIPILLRPVDWRGAPFGKLQALPKDAKAVMLWSNVDEAFSYVARGIGRAAEALSSPSTVAPVSPTMSRPDGVLVGEAQLREELTMDEPRRGDRDPRLVQTGGGASIGGSVDTGGGDFVGRDKVEYHTSRSLLETIKAAFTGNLAQLPDLLLRPSTAFAARFEGDAPFAHAVEYVAVMLTSGGLASIALNLGGKAEVWSILWLSLGTLVLWIVYAFFLHSFAYVVGARRGLMYTITAYLYVMGSLHLAFVFILWSLTMILPGAVSYRTITGGLGGSGGSYVVASGMWVSLDTALIFRVVSGVVILVYFTIGIAKAHHISVVRAASAALVSVLFFLVFFVIVILISTLVGVATPLRLAFG